MTDAKSENKTSLRRRSAPRRSKPGESTPLVVVRDGKKVPLTVRIGEQPGEEASVSPKPKEQLDGRLPGSVLGNKPPDFIGCTICGLRKPSSSAEWASTAQLNRAMEQDGDGDLGELVRRMRGS